MNSETIGGRVREVREKLGMSRREFADRLGAQEGEILNVEYNRLKKPEQKESLYRNIATEFNVSLNWLKTGEGCPETDSIDEVTAAFGDLAARKDPIIDGFILFLRSRTPEQLELIAQQMTECAHLLKQNNENKRD